MVFTRGQLLAFDFHGVNLKGTVTSITTFDPSMLAGKKPEQGSQENLN